MDEENSVHQKMMDESYEIWKKSSRLSYLDFLEKVNNELGDGYVNAVITGNLNYQVTNGGFYQWYDNRYYKTIDQLIDFLKLNFENEKLVIKVISLLEEFKEELCFISIGLKECKKLSHGYQEFLTESLDNKFQEKLENLDSEYYSINEDFMNILENYFKKKENENGKKEKESSEESK